MSVVRLTTGSSEETQELGSRIGAKLEAGDLLLLSGELGAGKTTLTQGIAWGAGVTGYAHSPTFVLVNEYAGRIWLFHLDLYRLDVEDTERGIGEAEDLGIDEMLESGACIVEWADRVPEAFPSAHLAVTLEAGTGDDRTLTFEPHGGRYEALLSGIANESRAGTWRVGT